MQRRQPIVVAGRVADDAAHDRHVVIAEPAAERVGRAASRSASATNISGCSQDRLPQRHDAVDLRAVGELSRRVDRRRRRLASATRRRRRSSRARIRADPSACGSPRTPGSRGAARGARAPNAAATSRSSLRAPARRAAAAAAACRAGCRESTCRGRPARSGRRATSPAGSRPCRADPCARRLSTVTRRNWLP